ncbi:MAG: type II toxin-antitoxin system VapC family toxin [Acidobacteriota bacterium]|nr:MAG: type II toxin-antitoxin system VapC family toxin [Acidobacteriota bacterium]
MTLVNAIYAEHSRRNRFKLIEDIDNEIYVSTASLWEIAIKISVGKLRFTSSYETFISQQLALNEFFILSASLKHYEAVTSLPLHHKDPFDRLIVAQAMVEQLPIISIDDKFDFYPVQRIW